MADDASTTVSWIRRITRFGWLSKGFVFVLIGVIAIRIATTEFREPTAEATQAGALRVVSSQPLGSVLLIVVSCGLVVFTVWNVSQSVIRDSTDLNLLGVIKRIGWFGLGLFYGLIAFVGFRLALSEIDSPKGGTQPNTASGGSNGTGPEALTARLLDLTGGRLVAIVVAIVVMIVAGYHLHKGVTYGFVDDLETSDLSPDAERWLGRLGVGGFVARAFVLAVTAFFLAKAAIEFDPDEAVGLDGALREFAMLSYGRVIIVAVGIGMALAGLYDMVTFRRQRLR